MTARFDVDRNVSSWLAEDRPPAAPAGLLDAVISDVATTPRRPGWQIADRWTWRYGAQIRLAARAIVIAAVVVALVLLTVWVFVLVGSPRPAPPFGLTRPGFIAFDAAEGIVVDRADGTDRHVIVKPDGQSISPTWSRDGVHLAYWHRAHASGSWSLVVVNPDGSGASTLATGVTLKGREEALNQPSNITWAPDGHRMAFAADVGDSQGIYVASLGRAAATLITDPALRAIDPAWSPDGLLIAFQSEQTGSLHVVSPDGGDEHQLGSLRDSFFWPDWAPDGSTIATMAFVPDPDDPQSGQNDVFTVSANGSVVTNISRDPADDFSPSWSPDGARLAWARIPADGSARAYIVVTRPGGPNVVEIRVDADLAPPVWSPDGTRLFSYVQGSDEQFHEVIVIDPEGLIPIVRLPAEGNIGNGNWQRLP